MLALRTLAVFLILRGSAIAQTDSTPQFEGASIKPAAPDQHGMYIRPAPGGRLNINNIAAEGADSSGLAH
jgi:hypothetical protein